VFKYEFHDFPDVDGLGGLSDLGQIYCGKAILARFSYPFR